MERTNNSFGAFLETAMDLHFMDELLFDGCWLETTTGNNSIQQGPSTSSLTNDRPLYLPSSESNTDHLGVIPYKIFQEETERLKFLPPVSRLKMEQLVEPTPTNEDARGTARSSSQSESFLLEGSELGRRWWIGPSTNTYPNSSVKDRLISAIGYLQQLMKERDFLIQIWLPVKRGGKNVLTTEEQPFSYNPKYTSLAKYRDVSKAYNFAAEADSNESVGLPGRVFLGKLPEWTQDVRFFRSEEYPRISYARKYNVCGSLALPVFERGSGTCLGVMEIVTTTQKINYRPELENVCRALEAFDLRSSQNLIPPCVKAYTDVYQAASSEVALVLEYVCKSHGLPLALTWAPCVQQGKSGSRHSDENFSRCISTVDSACFLTDEDGQSFLDACSYHHLLRGEGIVGRAFATNKLCFATDITAFSKTNYPLSHHARMFGFHAALAIPLRSKYTGSVELVLEFFLPKDCLETEGQKKMLNSLAATMHHNFRSSHLVMDKEIEEEVIFPVRETVGAASDQKLTNQESKELKPETSPEESSWIAHMMEANQKGKGVSLSWECQKDEPIEEDFKVTTSQWDDTQCDSSGHKNNVYASGESSSSVEGHMLGVKKRGEKRRTKTENAITLDVLRQHFTGSLKDAAKSMGVCPTTLKRICRQQGITRWPSRKIKKVGHSLKKLQLVMDSVQGVQGSIQLSSFYTSFPELSTPNSSANPEDKISNNSKQSNTQTESALLFGHVTEAPPKSPSSSGSQSSSGSSTCCSTGTNKSIGIDLNASSRGKTEDSGGPMPKRVSSNPEVNMMSMDDRSLLLDRSHHQVPGTNNLPLVLASGYQDSRGGDGIKVKVTFGEAKVRLSLQRNWGFRDLQQEIARRFNIEDACKFGLKYLDDDGDWVLLTCDADLEECIEISSQSRTINISAHQSPQLKPGSFGSILTKQ